VAQCDSSAVAAPPSTIGAGCGSCGMLGKIPLALKMYSPRPCPGARRGMVQYLQLITSHRQIRAETRAALMSKPKKKIMTRKGKINTMYIKQTTKLASIRTASPKTMGNETRSMRASYNTRSICNALYKHTSKG